VPDPEFRRFARQELRDRAWHAVRTPRQTLSTTQRSA
jgi:hypothetical protein